MTDDPMVRRAAENLRQLEAFTPRNPAEAQTHAVALDNCRRYLHDADRRSLSVRRSQGT